MNMYRVLPVLLFACYWIRAYHVLILFIFLQHRNYNHAFLSRGGSDCFERDGEVDRSCFTVTAYRFRSGFSFTGDWNFNHPATVQGKCLNV